MLPPGNIIRKHGISYANDSQLYISSQPDAISKLSVVIECVKDLK